MIDYTYAILLLGTIPFACLGQIWFKEWKNKPKENVVNHDN